VVGQYTSQVTILSTGVELAKDLLEAMGEKLNKFDPEQDAIIPMGRAYACLLAGMLLSSRLDPGTKIAMGLFKGNGYIFNEVEL
jgi:hypothetical protein